MSNYANIPNLYKENVYKEIIYFWLAKVYHRNKNICLKKKASSHKM